MFWWQRAEGVLVMKKVAGMVRLVLVSAEEGKNGLATPAPSPCMERGGRAGLTMGRRGCGSRSERRRAKGAAAAARQAPAIIGPRAAAGRGTPGARPHQGPSATK